jgi:putative molybdopterin biosynthesis protein
MSGSREQLRVRLGIVDGRRVAVPMRRGASVLSSLAHADALLTLPADRDGLCAGAPVEAELLRPRIDRTVLLAGAPDRALDLLALALDEPTRLAFCEMAPDAAIALVRDGGCHAALFAGPLDDPDAQLVAVRLAEIEVALAVADDEPACAIRAGARIAVGPRGTPARRMLPAAARAGEIVEARSDAAALAAVAAGHAECAVGALDAARRTGLRTASLGRAPLDLVVRRDAADRDPAVRLLLELTNPQTKENTTP